MPYDFLERTANNLAYISIRFSPVAFPSISLSVHICELRHAISRIYRLHLPVMNQLAGSLCKYSLLIILHVQINYDV